MFRTLPVALALVFATACGGSKSEPVEPAPLPEQNAPAAGPQEGGPAEADAPLSAEDRASVDRMIGLTVLLLDTLAEQNGDCDGVASSMNEFLDQNEDEIKTLSERLESSPEATKVTASREIEKAVEPKMGGLVAALQACQEHQGVLEAFGRLESL